MPILNSIPSRGPLTAGDLTPPVLTCLLDPPGRRIKEPPDEYAIEEKQRRDNAQFSGRATRRISLHPDTAEPLDQPIVLFGDNSIPSRGPPTAGDLTHQFCPAC